MKTPVRKANESSEAYMERLQKKGLTYKGRLSKSERRVVVAKDALKQLELEQYEARRGIMFNSPARKAWAMAISKLGGFDHNKNPAQEYLLDTKEVCQVCAKGALLVSTIRKFDKATTDDLFFCNEAVSIELFGSRNLDLMEIAFEGWSFEHHKSAEEKAWVFGQKYKEPHDRLVAILKNVVKNNGTFKP